jgi:hypothetical protein
MANLDALVWSPRPDVWLDTKDTWLARPKGYCCHIIYRESTKDPCDGQMTVVRCNTLVGLPMQGNGPRMIDTILRQLESGKRFVHRGKDKHMGKMFTAEKLMSRDDKDILKHFENDFSVAAKMMDDPSGRWKSSTVR